jgi:hypothetical protein
MTLIILSVVVIALFIAVLAIFLFVIGVLLNRTADNLGDSLQSVRKIAGQAAVIGPAIERINGTGATVVGALPLLCEGAENIAAAKSAPYTDPSAYSPVAASVAAPSVDPPVATPAVPSRVGGYLDGGGLGYMDA